MNPATAAGSASTHVATTGQLRASAVVAKLDQHETDLESIKSDLEELARNRDAL
jgi:hypothetical protein